MRKRNTKFKSRNNFSTHKRFQFSRYLNVPDGNIPRSILILDTILIVITEIRSRCAICMHQSNLERVLKNET